MAAWPFHCIVKVEIACLIFFLQLVVRIGTMFLPFVNTRLVERNDLLNFEPKLMNLLSRKIIYRFSQG